MSIFSIKASSAKKIVFVFGLLATATVNASIIDTSVKTGLKIELNEETLDATGTSSGATSASTAIHGNVTGASASSDLQFNSLTAEFAALNFSIKFDGAGYTSDAFMGQTKAKSNSASINYFAASNLDVLVDWNFDYTGSNPFGLSNVNIAGGPFISLGNYGIAGHHQGNTSFSLFAGNTYTIETFFNPNVGGFIGNVNGELAGTINFRFGQASVPESSGVALFGIGLLGLGLARRRKTA